MNNKLQKDTVFFISHTGKAEKAGKHWQRCRETGSLIHCSKESKLAQDWRAIRKFLSKLKIHIAFDVESDTLTHVIHCTNNYIHYSVICTRKRLEEALICSPAEK